MSSHLVEWGSAEFDAVEEKILLAKHNLHTSGVFEDENLIRMIDSHPAEHLGINTMGYDEKTLEWREGDRNNVPADVLLHLVQTGRLWINLRNVLDHQPECADVVNSIYDNIEANKDGFTANDRSANLLISSPGALVHYHIDVPVNMLWHIRGRKRVWVYPWWDFNYVAQEVLEAVCNNEQVEDVPYTPSYDEGAAIFDVEPGQLLTWPQMTPHRVTNLEGLNVSLSTEHKNPRAVRRINVHLANQWLRRYAGLSKGSIDVDANSAQAKQALIRVVRRFRKLVGIKPPMKNSYPISFKVDPAAPLGYRLLDGTAPEHPAEYQQQMIEAGANVESSSDVEPVGSA